MHNLNGQTYPGGGAGTGSPELRQVLRGLALNRTPGWNFPGNFLEVSFDAVGPEGARVSLEPGPHCTAPDGQAAVAALGVLVDIGMAAGMRHRVGLATRMATVAMGVQLTGAPLVGRLECRSRFEGFVDGTSARQGLASAQVFAGGTLVATSAGTFVALGNRDGMAPLRMVRREEREAPPLEAADLDEEERRVYARAVSAVEAGEGAFVDRFWGLLPEAAPDGAQCRFPNGMHAGNRVGHTQGGLSFALAAVTAAAALPDEWRLVGANAWYVSPGRGEALLARSTVVHRGSLTAVVRTIVADGEGRTAIEAMSHHSRLTPRSAANATAG